MKTSYLTLCAFLLTLVCSTAFAEQQALITVDPNNFAPGQNISKATTGAELRALTVVADPLSPSFFSPQENSGVYAQSVQSACTLAPGVPCSPVGSNVLGHSPVSASSRDQILWGPAANAVNCAFFDVAECAVFASELMFSPALRINFDTPTNSVTALAGMFDGEGGRIVAFAFDSAGQMVDFCSGRPGVDTGLPGCTVTLFSGGFDGWARYTLVHPNPDISFVVIGGEDNIRPIAQVQFNSPVSLQLAGLLTKVKGVGPGKSLVNKAMFAQTYYAVSDIQATCAMLTGFVSEVKAQSGKHINKLTASQLLATAQAIEIAIACH